MTNKKESKAIKKSVTKVATFSKSDILKSDEFTRINKDFLFAYLIEGQQYTLAQAKEILTKKLKGVVE